MTIASSSPRMELIQTSRCRVGSDYVIKKRDSRSLRKVQGLVLEFSSIPGSAESSYRPNCLIDPSHSHPNNFKSLNLPKVSLGRELVALNGPNIG